jgi:hypothetical protein
MRLKEKFLIYEYEKMVLSSWVVEGYGLWEINENTNIFVL